MSCLKNFSGKPKVKVTLDGQIFVWTITPTISDGFQYKFAQLFSIVSRCETFVQVGPRSKVKVMWARHVVPGQPSSYIILYILEIFLKHIKVRYYRYF